MMMMMDYNSIQFIQTFKQNKKVKILVDDRRKEA